VEIKYKLHVKNKQTHRILGSRIDTSSLTQCIRLTIRFI